MTASAQTARLLSLVPYLLARPDAKVSEVAAEFQITEAQLKKDLTALAWCGLPGLHFGDYIEVDLDAVDGTIRLTNADYLSRPLRFTADEAAALLLALRSLRDVADPEQIAVVDSAAAKLEVAAGDRAGAADRAEVSISGGDEAVRAAVHAVLPGGRRHGHRLHLTYDVASRAETTRRDVDPLRAAVRGGYAYLDAWCHSSGGVRSFRMDRIVEAVILDTAADPHPDVELPDPDDDWFTGAEGAVVSLELDPEAHWVAEYYPTVGGPDADSGSDSDHASSGGDSVRTVRFPVGDPAWLRGLLLRLGGAARVVAPAGAGEPARAEAAEALAQYRALGLDASADDSAGLSE